MCTMDGLIIKKHWLDQILARKKTWEIRGSNTKKRGQIALIESGSGWIVGTCEIVDSYLVTPDLLKHNKDKTRLTELGGYFRLSYSRPHAWVIKSAKRIDPVKYDHPQGAVIWVKSVLGDQPQAAKDSCEDCPHIEKPCDARQVDCPNAVMPQAAKEG